MTTTTATTTTSDARKRPIAKVFAIVEHRDARTEWVPVGVAWLNGDGSMNLTLNAEPLAWRHPATPHRLAVRFEDGARVERSPRLDDDQDDNLYGA